MSCLSLSFLKGHVMMLIIMLCCSIEYLISILGTDPKQARALILGNGA